MINGGCAKKRTGQQQNPNSAIKYRYILPCYPDAREDTFLLKDDPKPSQ
jgi:hypothetical protein